MTLSQDKVNSTFDVVIIGGGASGMACALHLFGMLKTSGKKCLRVALLEKNQRLGKKLLLTGNAAAISQISISHDNYHGYHRTFCLPALSAFDNRDDSVFEGLDFNIFDETGKGIQNRSRLISFGLHAFCTRNGYSIMFSTEIKNIEKTHDFACSLRTGTYLWATCVVVACGGSASPFTGSDGSGFNLLLRWAVESNRFRDRPNQNRNKFRQAGFGYKDHRNGNLKADENRTSRNRGNPFTDYGLRAADSRLSGWASRLFVRHGSDRSKPDVKISLDLILKGGGRCPSIIEGRESISGSTDRAVSGRNFPQPAGIKATEEHIRHSPQSACRRRPTDLIRIASGINIQISGLLA